MFCILTRLIGRLTRLLHKFIITYTLTPSPRWFPRSLARISSTLRPIRHIMQIRAVILYFAIYGVYYIQMDVMRSRDTFLNASPSLLTPAQLHSVLMSWPSLLLVHSIRDMASGPTSLLLCIGFDTTIQMQREDCPYILLDSGGIIIIYCFERHKHHYTAASSYIHAPTRVGGRSR